MNFRQASKLDKGERYVDFDEDSSCYGVYGVNSGFCYALCATEDQAKEKLCATEDQAKEKIKVRSRRLDLREARDFKPKEQLNA